MNAGAKDEDVIKAAEFCGIHQLILKMQNGYETLIGKDLANLSGGQKQRVALARTFFGGVKFVVLDEPNSNLDSEGEAALVNAIKKCRDEKITLIIITHKPSIAANCDNIMILQDGNIKAFGESKQILKEFSR